MRCAFLVCALIAGSAWLTTAAPTAPNVMALGSKLPETTRVLGIIGNNEDLKSYLSKPNTVCTIFMPTNEAMANSMQSLGKYVGIASQNETMQRATFNYHVIPGKALTAADLLKINKTNTRADETLWLMHRGKQSFLYSRPDYPVGLEKTDIKAGKCIAHTIGMALVPPSAIPTVQVWLEELDTLPPPPPRSEWGEIHTPLQAELVAAQEKRLASNTTAAAATPAGTVAETAAKAPTSGASSVSAAVAVAVGAALAAVFL